jgi:hypothetical protein
MLVIEYEGLRLYFKDEESLEAQTPFLGNTALKGRKLRCSSKFINIAIEKKIMIAKIYSCIGPIYVKIAEEKCNDVEEVMSRWKYACLIEFFDDKEEKLLYSINPMFD